ncbi:MAG: L,D-transpeptidase [Thermoanaerobaculia bacterium]
MSDRRTSPRPDSTDRRSFPRPPLWLNLLLLLLGVAILLVARVHRERVSDRFAGVIAEEARTPDDVRKVKAELAEMDLTQSALHQELKGRAQMIQSLKSEDFYLSVDTKAKKLRFYYGDNLLREGDVVIGEGRTIASPSGKSWTFVPLKGAFAVEDKFVKLDWRVPEWLYALNGQPLPEARPTIVGGLGNYVILLPNGYAIHSPPAEASPLKGPKPGSIMASEADLRAIWDRITKDKTQVYIF